LFDRTPSRQYRGSGLWAPSSGHPKIWLDNNPTERGLRGPVVGRRNHFGSKSERGTKVASILYSLIESAKGRGGDPARYLAAAVAAARRGTVLLPAAFADNARTPAA
jgi:hypothetical protein